MSSRLGIGVIGLGLAIKPHALALRDLAQKAAFVGGYSPSAERRAAFTQAYGLPAAESVDALLDDPRVHAVLVLTPPRTPADIALRAAQAGKHVLLEKPVDVDLPRARALVEAVERTGRTLGVVFQHRFRQGPLALRTLRSIDTEDVACAAVTYASGAVGVVDATTVAYPGYPERIDIAGTAGSAVIEGERLIVQRPGHPALEIAGSGAGGGGADPMAFSHEPHRRLIEDFLDAVAAGRAPRVTGRAALAGHALIDAILASSAAGAPVHVAATH